MDFLDIVKTELKFQKHLLRQFNVKRKKKKKRDRHKHKKKRRNADTN